MATATSMLLRYETTPGYAQLHRRRKRRRHISGQIATGSFGALMLAGILVWSSNHPRPRYWA